MNTPPTEHLDTLIASLTADIEVATERLRLARELRSTYDDAPAEAEAEPEPDDGAEERRRRDRERKAAQRAKKKKATGPAQVTCPDCGLVCGSAAGLGQHRKHKHPGSAAKPVGPIEAPSDEPAPAAHPLERVETGRMYCCSSCDAKAHTRSGLAAHTDRTHRRGLTPDEHVSKAVA